MQTKGVKPWEHKAIAFYFYMEYGVSHLQCNVVSGIKSGRFWKQLNAETREGVGNNKLNNVATL